MNQNQKLAQEALIDAFGPLDGKEHDPAVLQVFIRLLDRKDAEWTYHIVEQRKHGSNLWIALNEVLRRMGVREES
jgi:hypothetical protein